MTLHVITDLEPALRALDDFERVQAVRILCESVRDKRRLHLIRDAAADKKWDAQP